MTETESPLRSSTPVPVPSASPRGQLEQPPSGGKVKGTLLIARMKFLRGQGHISDVLVKLSHADQEVLQGILLPSTWYPNDLLMRLEAAMTAVIARGDRTRVFSEMGRFSAQANLGPGGVQRPYVREGDPHHLLERVPRMYVAQHTEGRRTYERTGDRSATIRTHDSDVTPPDDCLMVTGWLQRAIELSGGNDARVVETRCRARGDSFCEYRCSWT
jgi:uncharacterized protein (TIGR02265 family)